MTTCDDCGCTGYRANNPDGTRQDGSHAPDGETVLCDSPEDGGAMLCEDCYNERRVRLLYVVNGDAGHLEGWTVATLAAVLRPALAPLRVDVVERPNEFGLGGLQSGDDLLREEVRRIEERVIQEEA